MGEEKLILREYTAADSEAIRLMLNEVFSLRLDTESRIHCVQQHILKRTIGQTQPASPQGVPTKREKSSMTGVRQRIPAEDPQRRLKRRRAGGWTDEAANCPLMDLLERCEEGLSLGLEVSLQVNPG